MLDPEAALAATAERFGAMTAGRRSRRASGEGQGDERDEEQEKIAERDEEQEKIVIIGRETMQFVIIGFQTSILLKRLLKCWHFVIHDI